MNLSDILLEDDPESLHLATDTVTSLPASGPYDEMGTLVLNEDDPWFWNGGDSISDMATGIATETAYPADDLVCYGAVSAPKNHCVSIF